MNTPQFSVVIPTYNRALSLKRALDSLVSQTFKDFEVIVVDDGSTDHTDKVVGQYRDTLRITYVRTENWGGPARPRNVGTQKAVAPWVCFLDSDDWWSPQKLERISSHLSVCDVIYHDLEPRDESGQQKRVFHSRKLDPSAAFKDLAERGNAICLSAAAVRTSHLIQVGGFCEERDLISAEDYELWLKLAKVSPSLRFFYLNESLGYYWVESNSDKISADQDKLIVVNHCLQRLYFTDESKISKRYRARFSYIKAMNYLSKRKVHAAFKELIHVLLRARFEFKLRAIHKLLFYRKFLEPQLSSVEIGEVACLHVKCLPSSRVARLGERFARSFYSYISLSSRERIFVVRNQSGKKVLGSVVVSLQPWNLSLRLLFATPLVLYSFQIFFEVAIAFFRRKKMCVTDKHQNPPRLPELILIFTSSEVRRLGLGTKLLEMTEKWLRQENVLEFSVRTESDPSNKALAFYEKNGFKALMNIVTEGVSYTYLTKKRVSEQGKRLRSE